VNINQDTTVASGKNFTVTSGTTSLTGTTNINTSGSATTTIGNASATNAIAGTTSVLGTTDINTTGTAATSIGSATGGAVSIAANAASSFTTNTGALTLTSAAAATWGTNAGALTLQGAGGTTVTSTAGATSGDTTISTGNASAGASGNIAIDTGTATTTAGTVSIGTTNASGVTIGRAATTTTIQGTLSITPQASSSTTLLCTNGGVLSTCDASVIAPTATNFIQNQNAIQQTTANFWISGTGRADTSILTPTLDTATATTLNIGTTNATSVNINQNTVLASGKTISITGDTRANITAIGSPTEGMMTYDTTNKQLLVYANGKWQADRTTATKIVGTSAASGGAVASKNPDAADYVNTSTTSAQTQINAALTAVGSAGGTVYLMEGTYIIDGSISIPDNVTLAGSGQGTIIKLKSGMTMSRSAIVNTNTTTGTNVTVRDLKLDGNKAGQGNSVGMAGIDFNNMGGGSGSSARQGARIYNVHSANWYYAGGSNCQIGIGICLRNSNNNILSNNTALANSTHGIHLDASSYNTLTGNTTQGNTRGIVLFSGSSNTVTGNTAQGNGSGVYILSSSSNTITGNTVQGNSAYGIYVYSSSTKNVISSNNVDDTGGLTANDGITVFSTSSSNTITGNTITDTSCTTNCYAINIADAASATNYLANNTFSTSSGTATINDTGTNTIYAGQAMTQGGLNIRFKQANSTTAFNIQNANGISVINVDTTNGELEVGTYNGGTNPVAGKIVIATTANANTVTIASATQTTGSFTLSIPDLTANADVCTSLNNCGSLTSTSGIQNQNASAQTANFWISGTGRADTSILTPTLDTATATTLNIGTTNATSVNINQSTVLASGKTITINGDTRANIDLIGTPPEGMTTYDTTNKQLLTYSNGKWQADRHEAILVAADNSTQAEKDAADYVATGTGDQATINTALTAADPAGSGRKTGKVYLFAGTYNLTAAISVPNNTTLAGSGNATVITVPSSQNGSYNMISAASTTVIRDLKVDGNKAGQTSGTMQGVYLASNSTVSGVTITNIYGATGSGIKISGKNNTVSGNTLTNNSYAGVYDFGGSINGLNIITDNTVTGNAYGIDVVAPSDIISNNVVSGGTAGILISTYSKNIVTNNTVESNTYGVYLVSGASNSIVKLNSINNNGDGTSTNNGIYLSAAGSNTITDNNITDTSCTASCYAINISNAGSDTNYLGGNTFTGDGTYAATINDAGTNTIYAGQSMTQGGLDIRFKQANSTTAFNIQNANGVSVMNVDTTNGELEVGTYNGGTNPVAGKIVIATTANANTVTIASATQTGAYTLTIPALAGNATICTDNSTTACNNFIQNQTGTTQTAGFKINGAGTLGGLLTATAGATVSGAVINLNVSSNFAVNVGTGTTTAAVSIGNSANTTNLASRTINIGTVGATNVIQGVAQTTSNTTGDQLTIKGSAGLGSGNGGTLLLSGGDAGASGKMGLVSLNPTAFASSAVQSYGTGGVNNLTAGYVDTYSTIPATATISGVIMSIPDPVLNTTVGRILYVSATTTSQDFTLRLNASRTAIDINLKKNNTATLIWNGTDWTAAGASSATDLQAAYNNTQTNAGGAEIVLNSANQGAGVTIRNSGTPITGALFEVQSSIAANLFSVNNNTTEYASNGGIESGTTDWAGISTSPTQNSTLANVASGLYSLSVPITANNQGVKNTLVSTLSASTTYVVSFAVKTSAAGPYTFNTYYSVDGTANSVNCNNTLPGSGYTLTNNFSVTSNWTKISCFITTPASGMTASNAIRIYETNMGGSGTFYVDNLSVISNAAGTTPANVQIGGGATGGQPTLFTLDQFAGPPMTTDNPAYYGSMYYDTTKNAIQCYQQSSGVGTWGACGSAPDDIISMTPEYTGAVLNGTGVGTMTADFCANQTSVLTVGTLCASGEARNYYKWTSPQATPQTYGIYVTYRLPSTFKSFKSGTMSLTGLVDSTSNAAVKYAVFRKASAGTIYQCSADTTNIGTANTWTSISPTTDITSSSCAAGGANPFAAGDTMIIRITVSAQSNANAYVENLTFQYSNK
jgi:parallel beta-helix repeat protein